MADVDPEGLLASYIQEVWNEGDPSAVARFAAPGYRRHLSASGEPLDLEGQIKRLVGFQAAFPGVRIEVQDVVSAGDRIAFRSIMRGSHHGEFMGIAPTGRRFEVGLLDLIRIEDGLFAEQWGGPDLLDLLRQLGASVTGGDGSR